MKPKLLKLLSQKAQNTLEYSIVLSLVMAGIIIMSPYVISSWNALVKSQEDAVKDSFTDPLLESPDPEELPECNCDWVSACGTIETPLGHFEIVPCCGRAGCDKLEHSEIYKCSPTGCEQFMQPPPSEAPRCTPHEGCCSAWDFLEYSEGFCGSNVCEDLASKPPEASEYCADHPEGCPYGTILQYRYCGDGHNEFRCEEDLLCEFKCGRSSAYENPDTIDPTTATVCPGDEEDLTTNLEWEFVADCDNNDHPERKCQVVCCPGFCIPGTEGQSEPPEGVVCIDGTAVEHCSTDNLGYYCNSEAVLNPDCWSRCSCPSGWYCDPALGFCLQEPAGPGGETP